LLLLAIVEMGWLFDQFYFVGFEELLVSSNCFVSHTDFQSLFDAKALLRSLADFSLVS
jgi:hypothetical protein